MSGQVGSYAATAEVCDLLGAPVERGILHARMDEARAQLERLLREAYARGDVVYNYWLALEGNILDGYAIKAVVKSLPCACRRPEAPE